MEAGLTALAAWSLAPARAALGHAGGWMCRLGPAGLLAMLSGGEARCPDG